MSGKGNCWDNAPQESFFGRMKEHVGERIIRLRVHLTILFKSGSDYHFLTTLANLLL